MTPEQIELIKGEIRRHLAMHKASQDDNIRIYHLLVTDALCCTIENPVEVLTEK